MLKYDLILTKILWSKYGVSIIIPILQMWDWDSASMKSWKWHSQQIGTKVNWLCVVWLFQQTLGFYDVSGPELGSGSGVWGVHWGLTLIPARSSGSKAFSPWAPGRSVSSMLLLNLGMQMQTCFPACFWRVVPSSFSWVLPSQKINSETGWWEFTGEIIFVLFIPPHCTTVKEMMVSDFDWPQFPFLLEGDDSKEALSNKDHSFFFLKKIFDCTIQHVRS